MAVHRDSGDERADWLALVRAPGVGPVLARRLLDHFHHPGAVFGAAPGALRALGVAADATLAYLRSPARAVVDADLEWLARPGHHLLTLHDGAYPALLREIHDPPPVLFVRGDPALLSRPQIAVVGSRNPTPAGRDLAHAFAGELALRGLVITSGLAIGSDAAAHRGALDAGRPTIAVIGCGPERVYPARHERLAAEIARSGALVSEFPTSTPPARENFPRRNRIISGLALGTLVTEAAPHSGSLITARQAMEQGREVFAIPGSIHNPLARGCHALIRQGAKLVEQADDVVEEIAPQLGATLLPVRAAAPPAAVALDSALARVLEHLGDAPTPVDVLIERTGLAAERVLALLVELELRDYAAAAPGGGYQRRRAPPGPGRG